MHKQIKSQTLHLENRNRIVIPHVMHASSRLPGTLLRDALGAMENTYVCMQDRRVPTGESPTTLQTPGGAETSFQSALQVKITLAGISR